MAKNSIADWDSTAANNTDMGGISIQGTAPVSNFDGALRELMAQVADWTDSDTIASATTTNLASVDGMYVTVSGTATITSFGTLKAGMVKFLKFTGAGTITHNATSMILPDGVDLPRAVGDIGIFVSEGSGNWRLVSYTGTAQTIVPRGTVSEPGLIFAGDNNTGIYKPAGDWLGFVTAGANRFSVETTGVTVESGGLTIESDLDITLLGTGQVLGPPTSGVTAPAYAFNGDDDTGMFRKGTNSLGFSTAGVEAGYFDSSQRFFNLASYNGTTASAANTVLLSTGAFARSTSAQKYKANFQPLDEGRVAAFLKLVGGTYNSLCDGDNKDEIYSGVIADQADALGLRDLVSYGPDGDIEGFRYERGVAYLLEAVKRLSARVSELEGGK